MSTPNTSQLHSWLALIGGCVLAALPAFVPVVKELETQYPILGAAMPVLAVIWNNYVAPAIKK